MSLVKKIKPKGFTLIELLVVIAIIIILAAIVLISLNSARQKARDAQRVTDIENLQKALALYYDDNLRYPTTSEMGGDCAPAASGWTCSNAPGWCGALTGSPRYLNVAPTEPFQNQRGSPWRYYYRTSYSLGGTTYDYGILFVLERQNNRYTQVASGAGWFRYVVFP